MGGLTPRFEQSLTTQLGAELTPDVDKFWKAWAQAEGGTAAHNPFNTTQPAPGATDYNYAHVKNYPTEDAGIHATVATLLNGYYGHILDAVREGRDASRMATAVALSPWGTGSGVLRVLASQGYRPSVVPVVAKVTTTGGNDVLVFVVAPNGAVGFGQKWLGPSEWKALQPLVASGAAKELQVSWAQWLAMGLPSAANV